MINEISVISPHQDFFAEIEIIAFRFPIYAHNPWKVQICSIKLDANSRRNCKKKKCLVSLNGNELKQMK